MIMMLIIIMFINIIFFKKGDVCMYILLSYICLVFVYVSDTFCLHFCLIVSHVILICVIEGSIIVFSLLLGSKFTEDKMRDHTIIYLYMTGYDIKDLIKIVTTAAAGELSAN